MKAFSPVFYRYIYLFFDLWFINLYDVFIVIQFESIEFFIRIFVRLCLLFCRGFRKCKMLGNIPLLTLMKSLTKRDILRLYPWLFSSL